MDKRGTRTNGPKDKEIKDYAQGLKFERWDKQTDCMFQERKEGEDLLALKID